MFDDNFFNQFKISPTQIKVFIGTFIAVFIMVVLQNLGVRSPLKFPKLVIPIPKKADIMDTVRPKLQIKQTNFQLKKESGLISQTYAASASDYDNASAYDVVDMDTGTILIEKNGDKSVPIASLTKLMSAVVALDLASPSDQFTITDRVKNIEPTIINLTPGERISLEELLNGALITSANDAAEAIRDGVNEKYHSDVFINAMNEKASFLGLQNTHFANPQGFDDPQNYSSAEDLVKLTQYALTKYPLIADIVKKDYLDLPETNTHKEFKLTNWNGLLDIYPDTTGVKIGNTGAAGSTTIVLSNRGGKKIMAVLLGTPGILERDEWASELLDAGYQKTLGLDPVNVTADQLQAKYDSWYN